ncbi:hypothetical protein DRI50_04300 [candidate division KSB1 bacterium]|nr:MAG: hypothetical protein DRI50_04300 [candidate division KSB1 bacterium]
MMIELILTLLGGVLVGLLSSVLGLGGGIVMVPLLTIVFKMPQTQAVATSLMTIAFITLLNTYRFQKNKMINWRMVFVIVVFSAVSSFCGGYLSTVLNERVLLFFFILFVFYVFLQTLFLKHNVSQLPAGQQRSPWLWGALIGFFSGIISGTTGVGGGSIITPLLFKSRVEIQARVVPITNAVMLMNALFALIPLALQPAANSKLFTVGLIHIDRALLIFAGAVPASIWGTHYQGRIPLKVKKIFIAIILLIILIRMAYKFFIGI